MPDRRPRQPIRSTAIWSIVIPSNGFHQSSPKRRWGPALRGGRDVVTAGGAVGAGRAGQTRSAARGLPDTAVATGTTHTAGSPGPTCPAGSPGRGGHVAVGAGTTSAADPALTAGATGTAITDQCRASTPRTAIAACIAGPADITGPARRSARGAGRADIADPPPPPNPRGPNGSPGPRRYHRANRSP